MLLMIDNYDSFTYNVVQYLCELGAEVVVHRNDEITLAEIEKLGPDRIVISPGPCTPNEAGISMEVIRTFGPHVPTLGGKVIRAGQVMHGKTSMIHHRGSGVFRGLPNPFLATRYHSLVVARDSVPDCLEITAWTEHDDGTPGLDEIMGLRHREHPVEGVQFHPESILTAQGHDLLRNFLIGEDHGRTSRTGSTG